MNDIYYFVIVLSEYSGQIYRLVGFDHIMKCGVLFNHHVIHPSRI